MITSLALAMLHSTVSFAQEEAGSGYSAYQLPSDLPTSTSSVAPSPTAANTPIHSKFSEDRPPAGEEYLSGESIPSGGQMFLAPEPRDNIAPPPEPSPPDPSPPLHRVVLISNQRGIVELAGGLRLPLLRTRRVVRLREGWNRLVVSAPDHLTQVYRVFVGARGIKQPVMLALRPLSRLRAPSLPFELPSFDQDFGVTVQGVAQGVMAPRRPDAMSSSCVKLNASIPPTQRPLSQCLYNSLTEEIFEVGPFPRSLNPQESSAAHFLNMQVLRVSVSRSASQKRSSLSESLHRVSQHGSGGFEAAVVAAALQGDCHRVLELWKEHHSLGGTSATLTTFLALCYEGVGNFAKARELLSLGASEYVAGDDLELAALYYHYGRVLMQNSVSAAEPVYQRCLETFPWYRPCFDRMADIMIARGNPSAADKVRASFESGVEEQYLGAMALAVDHMKKREFSLAQKALRSLPRAEVFFTSAYLSALIRREIDQEKKGIIKQGIPSLQTRVVHFRAMGEVMKLMDSQRYPRLYEQALHTILRDASPERSYYLDKISDHYFTQNQCAQMRYMHFPEFQGDQPELYVAALDRKAQCYIKDQRYEEAEATVRDMQEIQPEGWLARYRMAEIYNIKGQKFAAINLYQYARRAAPDEETIREINEKIAVIEEDNTNNFSASAPSGLVGP